MSKIDIEFRSKTFQSTIGCVKKGVCGKIIHRPEPFAVEDAPHSLSYIQVWAVWRKRRRWTNHASPISVGVPSWAYICVRWHCQALQMYSCWYVSTVCPKSLRFCQPSCSPLWRTPHIGFGDQSCRRYWAAGLFQLEYIHILHGTSSHKAHNLRCKYGFHLRSKDQWNWQSLVFQVLVASRSYTHRAVARAYS